MKDVGQLIVADEIIENLSIPGHPERWYGKQVTIGSIREYRRFVPSRLPVQSVREADHHTKQKPVSRIRFFGPAIEDVREVGVGGGDGVGGEGGIGDCVVWTGSGGATSRRDEWR